MGIFRKLLAKNTLYYPGCIVGNAAPELNANYQEILKKLGIEFLKIDEFVCCGCPVLNAGFKEDYENLKEKNIALLDKYGINNIITPCPACLKMLKHDYNLKEKGIEVRHITEVLAENISKVKDIMKKDKDVKEITFHDPCHLGRHCGIYEEPRKILMKAGYNLKEFKNNRENADCCGGGGGVKGNFPKISSEIAKRRLKECKTKILTTACPLCYFHLKENSSGIEVKEFSEIIKDAL